MLFCCMYCVVSANTSILYVHSAYLMHHCHRKPMHLWRCYHMHDATGASRWSGRPKLEQPALQLFHQCTWTEAVACCVDAACVLQVARDLQAVCRPNPKKFRESCRKDKKHRRPADQESTGVERKLTFDVSSESEIEILAVKPSLAMETTLCPAEAYCRGPTCAYHNIILFLFHASVH